MPRSEFILKRPGRYLSFAQLRLRRERNRRIAWGVLASLALHFVAFNLIIWTRNDALIGRPSAFAEGGTVAGSAELPPLNLTLVSPPPQQAALATQAISPSENQDRRSDETAEQMAIQTKSGKALNQDGKISNPTEKPTPAVSSATNASILAQASNPANGTPDGAQDIIRQIARCLPQGVRPSLTKVRLNLQLDEKGQLATVPQLDIDLAQSTQDQVRDANLIVQATLQCGPYVMPAHSHEAYSIVADFSPADKGQESLTADITNSQR